MATQQEQRRRRLRRNQSGGGGSTSSASQSRTGRVRQAAGNAGSRAAQAGRGAVNRLRGASPRRSPGAGGLVDGGASASGGSGQGVRRGLRIGGRVLGTTGAVLGGAAAAGPALREGVGNMRGVTDLEGFSEGALDTDLGRVADSAAQTVAQATTGDPNVGRRGMTVVDGGTTSLNTDLRRGERRPENMRTDPQGRGPRGVIDREGRRFEITTMDARTAEGEEEEAGTVANGSGRLRLQRERPRTFGREGTTIDAARADEPEAAQLQGEVMAPGLPGVPESEQEVTRIQDGQGGVGVVRSRAGLRQGGGTFSTVSNAANAAIPIDNEGLHEARMAAVRRGERLPSEGGGSSRRERLRREINSSRGLNQSFGSMIQEGLRRRQARDEMDQLNALEIQERQAAIDARQGQQMTPQEIQEMQLDAAREARAQEESARERGMQNRDEAIESFERAFTRNGEVNQPMVDTAMGYLERSNELDFENPEDVRTARDLLEVSQALGQAKAGREGLLDVFAPDNPLAIIGALSSGDAPPDPDTAQQAMGQVLDAIREVRTDEDWLSSDDEVLSIGGTEILARDLDDDTRQRLRTLVERMLGGRNAPQGEISPSFRPRLRTSGRKQSTGGVRG